jgi:hypothetical protein
MRKSLSLDEAVVRFRSTVERISDTDWVSASDHRILASHFALLADPSPSRYGVEYRRRLQGTYAFVRAAGEDAGIPHLVWLAFLLTFPPSILTKFGNADRQELLERVLGEAATMPYPETLKEWAIEHVQL